MPVAGGAFRLRAVSVVLVAAVVLTGSAPAALAAVHDGASPFAQTDADVDPDSVLLSVDLQADGSAQWRVEYRVRLDDDNTTAAFDALQADVEANESAYLGRFGDRMAVTVQEAAAATGREMALRNLSVHTSVEQLPRTYGVLAYTFEWTGFAATEGDRLRAGDALAGLFLDADSTLLVSWPADYAVVDVSPSPRDQREQSVLWRGPLDFGPGEPDLVLSTAGGADGGDRSLVGVAVVGLALLGGGVWWYRSRRRATPAAGERAAASAQPSDDLLSNEERVIALLDQHGGRMKQQDVVEALGWTDAKTSQVVNKLRDAGRLEGFRLGRENVLRLPEDGSPPSDGDATDR